MRGRPTGLGENQLMRSQQALGGHQPMRTKAIKPDQGIYPCEGNQARKGHLPMRTNRASELHASCVRASEDAVGQRVVSCQRASCELPTSCELSLPASCERLRVSERASELHAACEQAKTLWASELRVVSGRAVSCMRAASCQRASCELPASEL